MKPNTNGQAQPDLIKEAKTKTRTYTNPSTGKTFEITEEEFGKVVEIMDWLRKSRGELDAQTDGLELEKTTQDNENDLKERAG